MLNKVGSFQVTKIIDAFTLKTFSYCAQRAVKIGSIAVFTTLSFSALANINNNYGPNGTLDATKPVILGSLGDTPSQAYIAQGVGGAISAVTGLVVTGVCCNSTATICTTTETSFGMFSNPSVNVSSTKFIGQNYLYNLLGSAVAVAGLGTETSVCTFLTGLCTGTQRYVQICATNSAAGYTGTITPSTGVLKKGCMVVDPTVSCTDNNGSTGGTWDPGNVGITTTA